MRTLFAALTGVAVFVAGSAISIAGCAVVAVKTAKEVFDAKR